MITVFRWIHSQRRAISWKDISDVFHKQSHFVRSPLLHYLFFFWSVLITLIQGLNWVTSMLTPESTFWHICIFNEFNPYPQFHVYSFLISRLCIFRFPRHLNLLFILLLFCLFLYANNYTNAKQSQTRNSLLHLRTFPLCRLLSAGQGASWWTFGLSSAYWFCPATPPT